MTNSGMGRRYMAEARGRRDLVRLALEKGLWATVVREAQECVELYLKGALRFAAVEPARSHDVSELLIRESDRFPDWFRDEAQRLASISTRMAAERGPAFYGDERLELGPQELFDEQDAKRAFEDLDFVASLCEKLLEKTET